MPRNRAPIALVLPLVVLAACGRAGDADLVSGYVEADLVYVAPPAAGTLERIDVRRGDAVKRGQRLFTLEATAETLARSGAAARRDSAAAQAANLRKGRRPDELRALGEQLAQARAALAASTAQLDRQRRLVDDGYLAPLRLDELRAARERDAARVGELQAQLAVAHAAARSDEIAAAAALERASAADLDLARWREAQRSREAPADALVYDVLLRPGEWANAGAPVLALLPPSALKLRFFVPQPQLVRAALGAQVGVHCDGCPAGLTARIAWVSPRAEYTPPVIYSNDSRAKLVFMVEAVLDERARTLLHAGQPVDVRLPAARAAA